MMAVARIAAATALLLATVAVGALVFAAAATITWALV